jgi:hypothetical protein
MTPGRFWEAHSHDDLLEVLFSTTSKSLLAIASLYRSSPSTFAPKACRRYPPTSPVLAVAAMRRMANTLNTLERSSKDLNGTAPT